MESKKRNFNEISVQDIMMKFKSKKDFYLYLTQQVSIGIKRLNVNHIAAILHPTIEPHQQAFLVAVIHGGQESIEIEPRLLHQCTRL